MPKLFIFDAFTLLICEQLSQITRFCGVKLLAWKTGCVKFLRNIMSESRSPSLALISIPRWPTYWRVWAWVQTLVKLCPWGLQRLLTELPQLQCPGRWKAIILPLISFQVWVWEHLVCCWLNHDCVSCKIMVMIIITLIMMMMVMWWWLW